MWCWRTCTFSHFYDLFNVVLMSVGNLVLGRQSTRSESSNILLQLHQSETRAKKSSFQEKCRFNSLILYFNNKWWNSVSQKILHMFVFFTGESGGSNYSGKSSAGSFWKCQDYKEWQLISICEFRLKLRRKAATIIVLWLLSSKSC